MRILINETLNEFLQNESEGFAQSMYALEHQLESINPSAYIKFETSSGEFWKELGVEDWVMAFHLDPMACYAHKEELESYLRNI